MKLYLVPKHSRFTITSISNEKLCSDAFRFGIEVGEELELVKNIPGGPIIVQKNEQQIAIGRELASEIEVEIFS